MITLFYL